MEGNEIAHAVGGVRRFNGATAVRPWKGQDLLQIVARVKTLQWGHGGEAVEGALSQGAYCQ